MIRNEAVASPKQRKQAVQLYRDTELTTDEIAAQFGVSRQTVHNWVKSAGVEMRGPRGPRPKPPPPPTTEEMLQALTARVGEVLEIVARLGDAVERIAQYHDT